MCISIFSPAKTFLLAVLVNKYKFPFFKKKSGSAIPYLENVAAEPEV